MKVIRKNDPSSFLPNGSSACAMKTITHMLMISGTRAIRVPRPINTKKAQMASAKVTSTKDGVAPIPRGSPNPKSPSSILINLGIP